MALRTSKDSGHFHYIEYMDSSGNGQTKAFLNKRTKKRHIHQIRNFVVGIAHGHSHRLRGKDRDGGGRLSDAPGAEDLMERRREQVRIPFDDRRGSQGAMPMSPRANRPTRNSSDLLAQRRGRMGNAARLQGGKAGSSTRGGGYGDDLGIDDWRKAPGDSD